MAALQQALQHVTVHVGGAGEAAGLEAITAIVPVDDRSPAGFKIALARVRQLAQTKQAELQARQTELQGILAEKMAGIQSCKWSSQPRVSLVDYSNAHVRPSRADFLSLSMNALNGPFDGVSALAPDCPEESKSLGLQIGVQDVAAQVRKRLDIVR